MAIDIGIKIIDKLGFINLNKVFKKIYYAIRFKIHLFWIFFRLFIVRFI